MSKHDIQISCADKIVNAFFFFCYKRANSNKKRKGKGQKTETEAEKQQLIPDKINA